MTGSVVVKLFCEQKYLWGWHTKIFVHDHCENIAESPRCAMFPFQSTKQINSIDQVLTEPQREITNKWDGEGRTWPCISNEYIL